MQVKKYDRVLYTSATNDGRGEKTEGVIEEFSPSGNYVKIYGGMSFWYELSQVRFLEVLNSGSFLSHLFTGRLIRK